MAFSFNSALSGAGAGASAGSAAGPYGAVIGGVAGGVIGGFSGGQADSADISSARRANELNFEESQRNREFQLMMSSTAHQREVKDLIAAGLNPMLSLGHGASTPSGSAASAQNERSGISDRAINRSQLALATAKAVSDMRLTNEMSRTEITKQKLNNSQADASAGYIQIPGLGRITLAEAARFLGKLKSSSFVSKPSAAVVARSGSKYSGYASGAYNRAGQRTGRSN